MYSVIRTQPFLCFLLCSGKTNSRLFERLVGNLPLALVLLLLLLLLPLFGDASPAAAPAAASTAASTAAAATNTQRRGSSRTERVVVGDGINVIAHPHKADLGTGERLGKRFRRVPR